MLTARSCKKRGSYNPFSETKIVLIDARIALYTPVYAFVNLFLHILSDLKATTTKSDLSILGKIEVLNVHPDKFSCHYSS
jgi:hypothetical protein